MEENKELTPRENLIADTIKLTDDIIKENDPQKFKDLTQLFKMNMQKKSIARANRLSNLLELIDDEAMMRMSTNPEDIDHDQLIKYMETTQKALGRIEDSLDQTPLIQINQQNNEINLDSGSSKLNIESRKKVLAAFREIIDNLDKNNNEIEVEDYNEI